MRALVLAAALAMCVAPLAANAGGVTEGAELEHARANARAGGPVSERDAELLERYGCSSGTRSAFCRDQSPRYRYYAPRYRGRYDRD
jgi:hypothetical protein